MMLVVVVWEWWCSCGDVAAVGWRVEESDSEDRVDPVMRFTFGLGRNTRRKTFPAAVGQKRWRPEVAAGWRGKGKLEW
ncbi:hypothetical protein Tco_0505309 [Tanacetum coccineum]